MWVGMQISTGRCFVPQNDCRAERHARVSIRNCISRERTLELWRHERSCIAGFVEQEEMHFKEDGVNGEGYND